MEISPNRLSDFAIDHRAGRRSRIGLATAVLLVLGAGVAWASADWNTTKNKADEFKRKADELARKAPEETRKIVNAICSATDDQRKEAGSSAASNASSAISDKFRETERAEREAIEALDQVDRDDKLKDKSYEARSLRSDITSRWDKLQQLTRGLRDRNNPVVDYMLRAGESARHDRMGHCDARDISVGSDRASCLMARGETCYVVEVTADNSSAISRGRDRGRNIQSRLQDELKKGFESEVMKRLIDNRRDFARCKRFEVRVDCYKQCPEVSDDNHYRESSPNWRESCSY
jgi:hypothetical protein